MPHREDGFVLCDTAEAAFRGAWEVLAAATAENRAHVVIATWPGSWQSAVAGLKRYSADHEGRPQAAGPHGVVTAHGTIHVVPQDDRVHVLAKQVTHAFWIVDPKLVETYREIVHRLHVSRG